MEIPIVIFLTRFFHARHEDIRDAILSLVTIFRDNSDKLERHEYRERQLGEQLKKALAGLDKRYRSQDQIIGLISEKLKSIETKMTQVRDTEVIFDISEHLQPLLS